MKIVELPRNRAADWPSWFWIFGGKQRETRTSGVNPRIRVFWSGLSPEELVIIIWGEAPVVRDCLAGGDIVSS